MECQQRVRHLRLEGDRLWEFNRFSFSDIADLKIVVVKWVEEDQNIVQSLVNKFGVEMECDGLNLYKTVVSSFMHIILVESTSAEKDKSNSQWSGIFSSYDPIAMADKIQKFWVIRQRLDPSVKGTIKYWTEHMWTFCPVDVRMACDNILLSDVGRALSSSFWTDESAFFEVLQEAL